MRSTLVEALKKRFRSYQDIMENVTDEELEQKPDVPKHKSLAEHLWCVVGARESYAKAMIAGHWTGFTCSLSNGCRDDFVDKLAASAKNVVIAIDSVDHWSPERDELLLDLFEHEVMHEGQIIRHLYGMERNIPASVKWA